MKYIKMCSKLRSSSIILDNWYIYLMINYKSPKVSFIFDDMIPSKGQVINVWTENHFQDKNISWLLKKIEAIIVYKWWLLLVTSDHISA